MRVGVGNICSIRNLGGYYGGGGYYINYHNNLREERKEIRALIDIMQDCLNSTKQKSIEYHTGSKASEELASELSGNLKDTLLGSLNILKLRGVEVKVCCLYLTRLRKAITLENFETEEFDPKDLSSEFIKNIDMSKKRLSYKIEEQFADKYKLVDLYTLLTQSVRRLF